jgi:hypothetical protein
MLGRSRKLSFKDLFERALSKRDQLIIFRRIPLVLLEQLLQLVSKFLATRIDSLVLLRNFLPGFLEERSDLFGGTLDVV